MVLGLPARLKCIQILQFTCLSRDVIYYSENGMWQFLSYIEPCIGNTLLENIPGQLTSWRFPIYGNNPQASLFSWLQSVSCSPIFCRISCRKQSSTSPVSSHSHLKIIKKKSQITEMVCIFLVSHIIVNAATLRQHTISHLGILLGTNCPECQPAYNLLWWRNKKWRMNNLFYSGS